MPGTIQVTVLEFNSVSSSSQPSAKSLKVSMGRRHFQTWDKGEFDFPITKIWEDLVVALLDAGGNEIAHADIRTLQIIEKGSWDEVFSLEGGKGGGRVHMKLRFVLSEEDRNRIRVMRELAMKKKHENSPYINYRISESASSTTDSVQVSVRPKSDASQDGSPSNHMATSSVKELNGNTKDQTNILGTAIPNATDTSQAGSSSSPVKDEVKTESPQVHERVPAQDIETTSASIRSGTEKGNSVTSSGSAVSYKSKLVSRTSQDDSEHKYQNQGPLDKTPSNVRKMISAFEKTQPQEMNSLRKVASVPSQMNRLRKERLLEVKDSKVVIQTSEQSMRKEKNEFITENSRETTASVSRRADISPRNTELSQVPKELEPSVTPNLHQTATSVGKNADFSPGNTELAQDLKELETSVTPSLSRGITSQIKESSEKETIMKELEGVPGGLMKTSTVETGKDIRKLPEEQIDVVQGNNMSAKKLDTSDTTVTERRESGLKSANSINNHVASHHKPKSIEHYKEEHHASQNSGMWIFPDNTSRLCITTAGQPVTGIPGNRNVQAKTSQEKKVSSEAEMFEKGTKYKVVKGQKTSVSLPESGSGSSPDDPFNGLVGQVIKVVVILGFGILVLLTRQKEPRKKSRKETVNLFVHQGYIEE